MKQTIPTFYPQFQCIASRCSDNCCIGWEIDIDPQTLSYYRSLRSSFGEHLKNNISLEDSPHFLLTKTERCPFLNEQNLCDIFLELGEEHLCEICCQHPRFHEWFGNYKESGLGLCCEEAVRLLISDPQPLSFQTIETDEEPDTASFDAELLSALISLRATFFQILQDRTQPLGARFQSVLNLASQAQELLDNDLIPDPALENLYHLPLECPSFSPEETLYQILDFLQTLEPIDPSWHGRLAALQSRLPELLHSVNQSLLLSNRLYVYEHLSVYFLYRYLLKSVWDEDLLSRVKLSLLSPIIIFLLDCCDLLDGHFSTSRQIQNIKSFSKEIEYCDENLELLLKESWNSDFLSFSSLLSLFDSLLK